MHVIQGKKVLLNVNIHSLPQHSRQAYINAFPCWDNACGTCPFGLHNVSFEEFTSSGVKFLCCHGYACAACDVRVIREARGIKRHIWRRQRTTFRMTRENFGKKETQLRSSPFSNFEGINVSLFYAKESRFLSTVKV